MTTKRFSFAQGDIPPIYAATLTDERQALDDAGTTVTFTMIGVGAASPVMDAHPASIISNPSGSLNVELDWPNTTTSTALDVRLIPRGIYLVRWKAILADGTEATFPSSHWDQVAVT